MYIWCIVMDEFHFVIDDSHIWSHFVMDDHHFGLHYINQLKK
jgi:hypothetical protein